MAFALRAGFAVRFGIQPAQHIPHLNPRDRNRGIMRT
jgi:hypothetical protein